MQISKLVILFFFVFSCKADLGKDVLNFLAKLGNSLGFEVARTIALANIDHSNDQEDLKQIERDFVNAYYDYLVAMNSLIGKDQQMSDFQNAVASSKSYSELTHLSFVENAKMIPA
ncbi:hypothetical protein O9G_000231 [Rozella allomycis CSF55]|uniref:Uncharacterized protein n=1 Tax=Rozella allomycis (strain CSF55) TaxID=988480 RepID=A0A075AP26_ROZAC|nr:hypothetical protein O9G_000231 [Rozella allomycis CSF55]|eukprot:EPZ31752.1 hypothetical protein O9G_000231 [Rozella allomycis CSF55]